LTDSVCCLSLASSCSTRNSTVAAYTVRFLPVWNPVMEGMFTICTLTTVITKFIHSIFKPGPNEIIKNKVKIMDKGENNYYNSQLSDIQLAQSLLWWVKWHNIHKELKKMKCVTHVNSNFNFRISSGQFLKCL